MTSTFVSKKNLIIALIAGKISNEEFDRQNETTDADLQERWENTVKYFLVPEWTRMMGWWWINFEEIQAKAKRDFGIDSTGKTLPQLQQEILQAVIR
ncbi:MAG: hypothetical protein FWD61_09440 [Phycisphaerales bacterium]|nr:hypothetical protein [Phycisphaerales bacterium]